MASKYDEFWRSRTEGIRALIVDATGGLAASADFSAIRPHGGRASWAGSASVAEMRVIRSAMAHMTSLGRVVAEAGLCVPWPEETFVFSMNANCALTVRRQSTPAASHRPNSGSIPTPVAADPVVQPIVEGGAVDPVDACRAIHEVHAALPSYTDPREMPFANGL